MSEPWIYPDEELLSGCCGAPSATEVIDGCGLCSRCKEWADFESEEEV